MTGWAVVGGRLATRCRDVTSDPAALDAGGFWVVVATFEGQRTFARFDRVEPLGRWWADAPPWTAPPPQAWASSMSRADYLKGVAAVRERIAAGDVYQVNLCRVLSAAAADPPDLRALGAALARGNPAPHAATVCIPGADIYIASASPELFLARDGAVLRSRPIKGTGRTAADLRDKDVAENVMIVDLVRNDLGRVAVTGGVTVPDLLRVEEHPGLVHLVSTVSARLDAGVGWADLLDATFPPGSVSGAPKASALRVIRELEPEPRGVYCGAVGWVDGERGVAELAVAIRTFEWRDGRLRLGTGAGITWGSDAEDEWAETELKVARLLEVR